MHNRQGGLQVRTRSDSDGIIRSTCVLIRSLPLAVLTRPLQSGYCPEPAQVRTPL